MSCFWRGLLQAISRSQLQPEFKKATSLIQYLKDQNQPTTTLWNGNPLSDRETQEHQEHINHLSLQGFYDTSACDPVLMLIAHLYQVDIEFQYHTTPITYQYSGSKKATFVFKCNRGHFQFVRVVAS